MHDSSPTVLSEHDYRSMQALLGSMIGARSPFAALVRRKLFSASVVSPNEVGPHLVTSGRIVQFKIDGVRLDQRELLWNPSDRVGGIIPLSLLSPCGLALLGMRAGQSIAFLNEYRRTQHVRVEQVFSDHNRLGDQPNFEPAVRPLGFGVLALPAATQRNLADRETGVHHGPYAA